jgi:hypothetical protein
MFYTHLREGEMSINPPGQPPGIGPQGPNPPAYMQLAPPPPGRPAAPGRNRWAVACLTCGMAGILGVPLPLCWVFGYVALFQIARTGQRGRLMVHLGFTASGIWILIIVMKAAMMAPST